jgi:hypothetical protein
MKRLIILSLLLVGFQAASAQNLLDSLQGNWTVTKTSINGKNSLKPGTLSFSDDGKFVSTGNYFGTVNALYTTNETTVSLQIETGDKKVTEWTARIQNGILYLSSVDNQKGKAPVVKIEAVKKE